MQQDAALEGATDVAPIRTSNPTSLLAKPSLRYSIKDGFAWSIMAGFGETYLSAFGIFLKALPLQVGMLSAIPAIVSALSQPLGVWLMERFRLRKQMIALSACIQGLLWLPIALLPFIFGQHSRTANYLIGMVGVYFALVGAAAPAWNSMIGDLVPSELRGRYFARRSKTCSIAMFVGLASAGPILDAFRRADAEIYGFLALFLIAFIARLVSAYFLSRHEDPPFQPTRAAYFSFVSFLRRSPHSNFARFVFFNALILFACNVAGPYFALYMLRELQFTYLQYTTIIASAIASQFLTLQHWGNLSDRFGNKRILNVCAVGIGLNPIMWLFSANIWYLVAVQLYAGFVWAGFNLAVGNFLYDAVSPPKRPRCVAYQSMVNAAFVLAGVLVGGFIVAHPPAFIVNHSPTAIYTSLFVFSGVLRLAAAAVFLPLFREVREVEAIRHHDLVFQIVQLRPMSGATFSLFVGRNRNWRTFRPLARLRKPTSIGSQLASLSEGGQRMDLAARGRPLAKLFRRLGKGLWG